MTTTPVSIAARARTVDLTVAAAHLVVALAHVTVAIGGASIVLPVALSLSGAAPAAFAGVDLAAAAAVVLLCSVAARVAAAVSPERRTGIRALELSQVSGISLFLVAQLNGVAEAGALILCYAIAAAAIGVLWVQGSAPIEQRRSAWPYSAGAAIAIVPWGVVALYQVVGLAVGVPPALIVRVLTIVLLVLAAALWWIERRWQLGLITDPRAELLRTAVTLGTGIALLVLAVGLARPSALL
ncbi:hypothetical protein [Microcella sp.]|uniref:hypothetical protein n=1 Tax=Microcella sp. TaxID=1913979 RepID=UPI00391B0C1B